MPVVAATARSMLFGFGGLRRGQRVLVHGSAVPSATSSFSLLMVQARK
jgi:NADPH:quinone reductase-like Zn-dependent oxidoreductase